MTVVTEEFMQRMAESLADRPVPRPAAGQRPGPEDAVIVFPLEPVEFNGLVKEYMGPDKGEQDREFALGLLGTLHELEVERASQPPVIHMTVPSTQENGLAPGQYEVRTGPMPRVTFTPNPENVRNDMTLTDMQAIPYQEADAPDHLERPRTGRLTGFLARHHLAPR
jgi:hypothetical protein